MMGFMMTVKAGELWIAEITFTDGSASKKRPILILWIDGDDVVVAAVTKKLGKLSANDAQSLMEVWIQHVKPDF
jgi:hypothetical protein